MLDQGRGTGAIGQHLELCGTILEDKPVVDHHLGDHPPQKDGEYGRIYDEDLHALVAEDAYDIPLRYELVSIEFKSGTNTDPWSKAVVRFDGEQHTAEATGNGPVNAVIEAIRQCTNNSSVTLEDYRLTALTGGADAQARASVKIADSEIISHGQGIHIDVVMASALAFVNALNHQARQRERQTADSG